MRLEARKYLFDIRHAADSIAEFCKGKDFEHYRGNPLLQACGRDGVARRRRQVGPMPRSRKRIEFVAEALAADASVETGAPLYRARDVHQWLERLARGEKAARPVPLGARRKGNPR